MDGASFKVFGIGRLSIERAVRVSLIGVAFTTSPIAQNVPPFPYRAEDVLIPSVSQDSRIGGTLTLPNSATAVPAVILIGGSGPQDRDGAPVVPLAGIRHKPLLVLADHLTRSGIAVLRADQRGVGESLRDVLAEI